MKRFSFYAHSWFFIALGFPFLDSASLAQSASSDIVVRSGDAIEAVIAGKSVKLLVSGNGFNAPVLNPDAAARLNLFSGQRIRGHIGPVKIVGTSVPLKYQIAGLSGRGSVRWFDRPIAAAYDGSIGVSAFEDARVTLMLRPDNGAEIEFVLPLVKLPSSFGSVGTVVKIANQTVFVQWDFTREKTLLSAAVGASLANANGGELRGAVQPTSIRLGITRPIRQLVLSKDFSIGPHLISEAEVRISDNNPGVMIPDAEADASEIVVTAKGQSIKPDYNIQIGSNAMRKCSTITFDNHNKKIILRCSV